MNNLSAKVKRNINIFYISEISRSAILFQSPIWFSYESGFLSGEKIAFFSALILLFDVLFQIPTGAFADIFGKKLTLTLGNFLCLIAPLLIAIYPSEISMLLYCLFYGMGNAFLGGTYSSFIYNMLIKENRVDLYQTIKANGSLRFQWFGAVFIVLGGYAYTLYKPLPYYLFALGVLVAAISAFFISGYDDKSESKFNFKAFIKQNILGFKEIFKNSEIAKLSIAFIFMGAIAYASQRYLVVPYMTEIGLDEVSIGWFQMAFKLLAAFTGFFIIKKTGLVKSKYFILIIPIVMVLAMVPARYFAMPVSTIFLVGIAFASSNADLFMSPIINAKINSNVRTTALSAVNMLTSTTNSGIQLLSAPFMANQKVGDFYQLLGVATAVIIIPLMLSLVRSRKVAEPDLSLVGD